MKVGTQRDKLSVGLNVGIILKTDQRTGKITKGIIQRLLTKSSNHTRGIKVQLEDGKIGRVCEIYNTK